MLTREVKEVKQLQRMFYKRLNPFSYGAGHFLSSPSLMCRPILQLVYLKIVFLSL